MIYNKAMKKIENIKLFLFDLDGTILDSLKIWNDIDLLFFKNHNLIMGEDYHIAIAPLTLEETATYTKNTYKLDIDEEQIMKEWSDLAIKEYAENVNLKKGVKEFLDYLKNKNVHLAIATSCNEEMFKPCLERYGIVSYFEHFYTSQNLKINKSNTNFFKEILNEYKIEPDQILFFEDSLASMKCAKSLGFNVVAVMDKKWEKQKEEIIASSDDQIEDFSQFILNR
ncbi:MAG: HAD-IA family hydrolase [Bacilli bacterium]